MIAYYVSTKYHIVWISITVLFNPGAFESSSPAQHTGQNSLLVIKVVQKEVLLESFYNAFIAICSCDMFGFQMFRCQDCQETSAFTSLVMKSNVMKSNLSRTDLLPAQVHSSLVSDRDSLVATDMTLNEEPPPTSESQ